MSAAEKGAARHLEAIRSDPRMLHDFFYRVPTGADLHNHLSGR
ncbi:hypothetical protein [Streptomyces sp. NPDC023327]